MRLYPYMQTALAWTLLFSFMRECGIFIKPLRQTHMDFEDSEVVLDMMLLSGVTPP